MPDTHRCPRRGCRVTVPNHLFACRAHWYALSKPTRDLIWATSHLPVFDEERQAAFRAADEDWEPAAGGGSP
jgi:hypothetical protein